jgi:hypothetical protein
MTTSVGRAGLLIIGAMMAHLAVSGAEGVHVCIGADRVLRLERAAKCPAGATEYFLAEAQSKLGGAPAAENTDAAELTALRQRVAALSEQLATTQREAGSRADALAQRIAALEASPRNPSAKPNQPATRVVAPFEVVDPAGKTILAVRASPRGLTLLDDQGRTIVAASALASGGFVKALAADGTLQTIMGVNGKFAGFVLRDGDQSRGTLAIAEDGKPILNMSNDNHVVVVALTQAASGGGYLQLGNAAGSSTVEAGTTADGVGLVRAYPLGNPGAGLVGMPGTFIIGRRSR